MVIGQGQDFGLMEKAATYKSEKIAFKEGVGSPSKVELMIQQLLCKGELRNIES